MPVIRLVIICTRPDTAPVLLVENLTRESLHIGVNKIEISLPSPTSIYQGLIMRRVHQ